MAKLARHLGETIPPHLITAKPSVSISPPKEDSSTTVPARKKRSMSVGSINAAFGGMDTVLELGFSQHKPAVGSCSKPEEEETQGRSVSWVGEWNCNDMQEVQKQLRALK